MPRCILLIYQSTDSIMHVRRKSYILAGYHLLNNVIIELRVDMAGSGNCAMLLYTTFAVDNPWKWRPRRACKDHAKLHIRKAVVDNITSSESFVCVPQQQACYC
jgi:hypothetical protein